MALQANRTTSQRGIPPTQLHQLAADFAGVQPRHSIKSRIAIGDGIAGETCNPACAVVEEPQCAEQGCGSHVEPVTCACWYTDQITLLAEDKQNFLVDMETEQPLTLHEEADFVFGMDVFCQEFAAERDSFGMVRVNANCIDRDIALDSLDSVDFFGIDAEDFSLIGPSRQASAGRPLLKSDSASSQLTLNGIKVDADALGMRRLSPDRFALVWKDAQKTLRPDS